MRTAASLLILSLLTAACAATPSSSANQPTPQTHSENTPVSEPLIYFDVYACLDQLAGDSVLHYDAVKFIASLQGLVNRDRPRLVLRFIQYAGNHDDFWLEKLGQDWLKDRPIQREHQLERLWALFPEAMQGAVVWDPAVPATANLAATICGVEGWLPVRAESELYQRVIQSGPQLPVKLSLVDRFDGSRTGSAKCDAYLWAKEQYLDTGKTNPTLMAYYIDAYTQAPDQPGFQYHDLETATLANHDYYIARRAFFFDLGVWPDEAAVDEPDQPHGVERETLIALLQAQYKQNHGKHFTTIGGFTPWDLKYTTHKLAGGTHDPVATEWEYAAILSAHNAVLDADALGMSGLANASAYSHYPLKSHYKQNPRPARSPLENKTYVYVYMGDYDSAAWLSRHIPTLWDDPGRGSIPLAWAFNPNLSDRVPNVFDYIYRTKTENDWFIAGDSGAGYLNPNLLIGDRLGSGLPDALDLWVQRNQRYFDRFDYSITGFVINGFHGDMPLRVQKAYTQFSPDGVGMQLGFASPLVGDTPFIRQHADIYPRREDFNQTAGEIAAFAKPEKPQFLMFRMILQQPATLHTLRGLLNERHGEHNWEFCDPYTFFDLYERHLKGEKPGDPIPAGPISSKD